MKNINIEYYQIGHDFVNENDRSPFPVIYTVDSVSYKKRYNMDIYDPIIYLKWSVSSSSYGIYHPTHELNKIEFYIPNNNNSFFRKTGVKLISYNDYIEQIIYKIENGIYNYSERPDLIRNHISSFNTLQKLKIIKTSPSYILLIKDHIGKYEIEFCIEYYLNVIIIKDLEEFEIVKNNQEWFNKFINKMKLKYGYNNFSNTFRNLNSIGSENAIEKYLTSLL